MNKQPYTIKRNAGGTRFVHLNDGTVIPAEIAGLAAGPDKWLSEIQCACRDCKQAFTLRELEGGQWCEECATAGIE
jgi:hypothetical protein